MRTGASSRIQVVLVCEKCGGRNYKTSRSRRPDAKTLEVRKFCPACKVHTVHKESK